MVGGTLIFSLVMLVFILHTIKPIEYLKWVSWKKMAKKAISDGRTTKCRICQDHIFPGDKVVKVQHEHTHPGEFLVHIAIAPTMVRLGGHFSLKSRYKSCALLFENQKNLGTWNGSQFIPDPNSPQVS